MATSRLDVLNTRSDGQYRWRTLDEHGSTYWSGLDCQVFFDQILLEEVVQLQWELQEAVMPLFGYNDYTYRTTLHGARRVQGSITINFQEAGFIYRLLRQLEGSTGAPNPEVPEPLAREAYRMAKTGDVDGATFLDLAFQGGALTKDARGRSKVDPKALGTLARDFEQAIWGDDLRTLSPASQLYNAEQLDPDSPRFARREGPILFDMYIQFGSADPAQAQRRRLAGGRLQTDEEKAQIPVYTRRRLTGVEINGSTTLYDDSGRPIMETYQFLAKDAL